MGLIRTALVFGAGYALGNPEARKRLAALAGRPEVKRVRKQGVDLVGRAGTSVRQAVASRRAGQDSPASSEYARHGMLPPPTPGAQSAQN